MGLSLGLELQQRGLSVVVLERHQAMQAASWAAGGMLAARDPENPPALLPLSLHSLELYPAYLARIERLSGRAIPIRTHRTLQRVKSSLDSRLNTQNPLDLEEAIALLPGWQPNGRTRQGMEHKRHRMEHKWIWLEEQSLDPRDLCSALPIAFVAEQGTLLEGTPVLSVRSEGAGIIVKTAREEIHAAVFVNCCGAWAGELRLGGIPVEPVKGQMATVKLAPARLQCVLRTEKFYAIPRGDGRVVIGATVEHAGFDPTVNEDSIAELLHRAAEYLPEIAGAPKVETWAGFRPGTPDGLPILGRASMKNGWHATGHFRNGVLLAPVTARAMARAVLGDPQEVSLDAFSATRFPENVNGHAVGQTQSSP